MRHTEQIVDYIIDGSDLIYNDNHGALIRCKDCKHYNEGWETCKNRDGLRLPEPDEFCSRAERMDV